MTALSCLDACVILRFFSPIVNNANMSNRYEFEWYEFIIGFWSNIIFRFFPAADNTNMNNGYEFEFHFIQRVFSTSSLLR